MRRPRDSLRERSATAIGVESAGFSVIGGGGFRKGNPLSPSQRPHVAQLIAPIFVLFIFRFGAMNFARHPGGVLGPAPDVAFPAALGFALLTLSNLVYNNFGGDGGGIQFFYACPVRFRDVVLAKNLTHAGILVVETAVAWIAVAWLYGSPTLGVTVAALAALLFAAPVNFTAGDLLSIYSPKKFDYSTFGRQRASQIAVLISFGAQIVLVAVGVGVFWLARHYENLWLATLIFLVLAGMSLSVYSMVLGRMDRLALQRRETLVAELCRA